MLGPLGILCTIGSGAAASRARPDFIFINCDNMGYGDLSSYGSAKPRTPNVGRPAQEGICFTGFDSTSGVCTPSRTRPGKNRRPAGHYEGAKPITSAK